MPFYVYLLRCSDGSFYAGHTANIEGRLWQHEQGLGCDWNRINWLFRKPSERAVRPERSAMREVEGRHAQMPEKRPSTSLRTNGMGASQ